MDAMRRPLFVFAVITLAVFAIAALLAPWIAPYDPAALHLEQRLLPPGRHYLLGTDELGRDIFSRILFGARLSLSVAISVVGCSLIVGGIVGAVAGFYSDWRDTILNVYVVNAFMAMPGILLAIAFVAFLGPGLRNVILALTLSGWVNYARLVRAQVMSARQLEYVEAARSLGASDLRIVLRHILPNIAQPIIIQAALGMAAAVLAEATLSFLGLGVPPPSASWGSMLNDARAHLFDAPHTVLAPAIAVMLCVLAFSFLGDALRDWADPRSSSL
jgi:peptide/nickel transport system permease protein